MSDLINEFERRASSTNHITDGNDHDVSENDHTIDSDDGIDPNSPEELADEDYVIGGGKKQAKSPDSDDEDEDVHETRRDRRRNRGKMIQELEARRQRESELNERIARLEGQARQYEVQAQTQQSGKDNSGEQFDAEVRQIYSDIEANNAAARASNLQQGTAEYDQYMGRHQALESKKFGAYTRKSMQEQYQANEGARQRQSQIDGATAQRDAALQAMHTQMQTMYADVYADKEALQYANHAYMSHPETKSNPGKAQLDSLNDARREFELTGAHRPDDSARARFSGSGRGRGGGGGSDGRKSYAPSSEEVSLAMELYSDLSPRAAVQKWVNTIGKDIAAQDD